MTVTAPMSLTIDWTACDGRGMCAELLPELIRRDDWGYPIVEPAVPPALVNHARRAVRDCPVLALRLVASAESTARHRP